MIFLFFSSGGHFVWRSPTIRSMVEGIMRKIPLKVFYILHLLLVPGLQVVSNVNTGNKIPGRGGGLVGVLVDR